MVDQPLTPAQDLVARNPHKFPNESAEYRRARNALLVEEIELRRHIERVAEQRRRLPPGGEVRKEYRFESERGPVGLADMFGDRPTLVIYSYMFGPQRERPCPMCTNVINAWEGNARDIEQRAAFAVVVRSPIERAVAFKNERGWKAIRLYSDMSGDYTRDYVHPDDLDIPAYTVFTRKDGVIRHFWSGEMTGEMSDPGQDPRGAPDFAPLWGVLDTTPEGRGKDWYPQLDYPG
jgi:predicted dithiol-disulfide oxidoreductase (DUF899 family)